MCNMKTEMCNMKTDSVALYLVGDVYTDYVAYVKQLTRNEFFLISCRVTVRIIKLSNEKSKWL